MTLHEAIQRLRNSSMAIRRYGAEWCVYFEEDKRPHPESVYVTDDLEDAVIAGSNMRLQRLRAI